MLSILIPIYEFDVRAFVESLVKQCEAAEIEFEVLCIDDCSSESIKASNRAIKALPGVRYDELDSNLGRAAIRNEMALRAMYENLLILDCDGACPDDQFIERYLKYLDKDYVVYGGRIYSQKSPEERALLFHWMVGRAKEAIDAQQRQTAPYKSFMTNNFLISRKIFAEVRMDERLMGYGHEDTLFAADLRRANVVIAHIDNPLLHIGLEPVDVFIQKSSNGIKNLSWLVNQKLINDSITLYKAYKRLSSVGLQNLFSKLVLGLEPRLLANFRSSTPSLRLFDLWKLAHFVRCLNDQKAQQGMG